MLTHGTHVRLQALLQNDERASTHEPLVHRLLITQKEPSQVLGSTQDSQHRNTECSRSIRVCLLVPWLDDCTTSPSLTTQGSLSCLEVSIAARSTPAQKPAATQLACDSIHQTLAHPEFRIPDSRQRFKLALQTLLHAHKHQPVECASPCK
jgi:hypothetical protein